MNLYQPTISGSLTVSGSVEIIGPFTMSGGSISGTASFAQNAGLLSSLDSSSFVGTGSYNTLSSSFTTVSSSYSAASGSFSTRVSTLETASGSFSGRVTKIEGNYATTGSNIFTGAQTVCANITSTGTIIAQTLNVQQVTSSVIYSSGSNVFGCSLSNTQQFTGSMLVTGSNALFSVGCVGIGVSSNLTGKINLPPSDYGEGINFFPDTNFYNRTGIGKYTSEFRFYIPKGDFYSWYSCGPTGTEIFRLCGNDGAACFSGSLSAASVRVGIDCSGVIVDVQCRHGLMKYYNYSTGLVGSCCNTDSGVSTWLGRFAGPITAPTAVYQDLIMTACGIACFRCQVCAPTFVASGLNIDLGTTSSNTYKALNFINDCNTQGNVIGMARNDGQFLTSACGGDFIIGAATNKKILFGNTQTGTTEYMRISSGGKVIVGTDSSNALEVFSNGDTEIGFSYSTRGNVYSKIIGDVINASPLGGDIAFQTATGGTLSERMRITCTGNVLIGKSNDNGGPLQVSNASNMLNFGWDVNGAYISSVNNANTVYKGFQFDALSYSFFTSAGNADLTITNTGCVGIGIATPSTKLHVYDGASIARMLVENSTNSSYALYQSKTANSSLWQWGTWNDNTYRVGISGVGDFITVESNGEVGIGTTAPQSLLHVCRGDISLEIGAEGNSCKLFFSVDHNAHYIRGTGYWVDIVGNENEILRVWKGDTSIAACEVIRVTGTGITCFKATVCAPCFATISDYRMKYDVKPITNSIGLISQMKPYSFKLNYDCQTSFGMIAHELQEVLPEAVFGVKDGEVMQGVDYMKLLPISIKAIQEQQYIINQLKCENYLFKTCLGIA